MATGSADERMAFVLETEAKLEGVRAARAEITGVGTDASALSVRLSQMSETSRAAFEKLSAAEQKTVAGFIGVKQGADQSTKALDQSAAAAARMAAAAGSMVNPAFAAAAKRTAAENANLGETYSTISPKARSAANAISMLTLQMASGGGSAQGMAIAAGTLTSSLASMSRSATIAASASGIGALIVVAATVIPLLMRMRDAAEDVSGSFSRTLTLADESTAGAFLKIAQARKNAAIEAFANAPSALSPRQSDLDRRKELEKATEEAIKDEQLAIAQVFAARRNAVRKAQADALAETKRARQEAAQSRGMGEEMRGRTIQLGIERTSPELAAVTGIQMQQAQREAAIDKMTTLSQEERDQRKLESARQAEAEISKIYNDAADKRISKADEEARKQEDIDKRKAAKRLDIAKANVHAIVTTEGSVLQTMRRLALQPIVDRLEGIAAQQAVEALASWPNPAAMAAHGLAAAAAVASAREVAGWMGGGGSGGSASAGSGGGGSGGGSSSSTSAFEPREGAGGMGTVVINVISNTHLGWEQVQQLRYELNRANILKGPIPNIAFHNPTPGGIQTLTPGPGGQFR